MIHYALKCEADHAFDGWFASSAAFERQREEDLLACPVCGSTAVDRGLMAPAVTRSRHPERPAEAPAAPSAEEKPREEPREEILPPPKNGVALDGGRAAEIRQAMRALRQAVEKHGVDVGRAFPEEARKIHYGESEPRGIYGEADPDEARDLIEEGISILPLPVLPDDRN